jgi:lipoprotein-anchoring transpeptidase ErfK/SrfK
MSPIKTDYFPELLQQAMLAYNNKDLLNAKRYAKQALKINAHHETPWLILAATTNPQQALAYLEQGLLCNPDNERIKKAIQITQSRISSEDHSPAIVIKKSQTKPKEIATKKTHPWTWLVVVAFLLLGIAYFNPWYPVADHVMAFFQTPEISSSHSESAYFKPTLTPTNTATFTPTPTSTLTPTPTITPSPTPTQTNTPTITPSPTASRQPTATPPIYDQTGRWIDVNFSTQMLYAYEGSVVVNSFLVSTGMYYTPTVTGQYNIYVKYEYTDMSGPGYYIPNVPYTQYFYSGYGIHAATWHNNFGTPMSHGCINMRLEDAKWLFDWTSIGTLVNIHY